MSNRMLSSVRIGDFRFKQGVGIYEEKSAFLHHYGGRSLGNVGNLRSLSGTAGIYVYSDDGSARNRFHAVLDGLRFSSRKKMLPH